MPDVEVKSADQSDKAPERPAWLPEKFENPEALAKSYTELETRLGEMGRGQEVLKKWEAWGDPDTIGARLGAYVERQLAERMANAKPAAAPAGKSAAEEDAFERWEEMTPREQAAAMRNHLRATLGDELTKVITQQVGDHWNRGKAQIDQYGQTMDILTRALDLKLKSPELDLQKLYGEMAEVATAKPDRLMNLAYEHLTSEPRLQARINEAVATERAKWEQEEKNKSATRLNGLGQVGYRVAPRERSSGNTAAERKESALRNLVAKGIISPEQI